MTIFVICTRHEENRMNRARMHDVYKKRVRHLIKNNGETLPERSTRMCKNNIKANVRGKGYKRID